MNRAFGSEYHTTTAVNHRKKTCNWPIIEADNMQGGGGVYLFGVATMLNHIVTGTNPKISVLAQTTNCF